MSKKFFFALAAAIVVAAAAGAQNLSDNQYRKSGQEYEKQANAAMDAGDYAKAAELADLAAIEYRKSKEYAETQMLKFRAANAISIAQQNITDRKNVASVRKHFAKELASADALLAEAKALYAAENWVDSRAKAIEANDALKDIKWEVSGSNAATSPGTRALPRFYTVVSRPKNTDCFWNIAKMPQVYDNPHKWQELWKANANKLRDPENPNLIFPGMVLEIPSIAGETREGTYDPSLTYPTFGK